MFYTYLWLREDGTPYYVGKGKSRRAYINNSHNVSRPLQADRIIVQYFDGEEEAFEAEKFLISYFGRADQGTGCLRNLTDGGENPPNHKGHKRTKETRKRISESTKGLRNCLGRKLTKETKEKISRRLKSRVFSLVTLDKMRKAKLGNKNSLGHKGFNGARMIKHGQ